jgi:hypothetical protein
MTPEVKTIDDQLALVELAFTEARNHDKPVGVDGLPFLRKENRWWDTKVDTERTAVQFTDVHQCNDDPVELAAMIAHTKDRVRMSVEGSTNTVLVRILVKYETRHRAEAEPDKVIEDRFLVEFQWVMPLGSEPPVILLGGDEDAQSDFENDTPL